MALTLEMSVEQSFSHLPPVALWDKMIVVGLFLFIPGLYVSHDSHSHEHSTYASIYILTTAFGMVNFPNIPF